VSVPPSGGPGSRYSVRSTAAAMLCIFLPEPRRHGSFRPTFGSRAPRFIRLASGLTCRCSPEIPIGCHGARAAMCAHGFTLFSGLELMMLTPF